MPTPKNSKHLLLSTFSFNLLKENYNATNLFLLPIILFATAIQNTFATKHICNRMIIKYLPPPIIIN
ncbi:MAG: hypothetical protein AUJ97_03440 [Bacteroidetes bacterium CG2_30_32_10]|nr:MAG: hypothetical protein AUJ97_03440 [Bacteroidetes bacterium CG2_30_32_10]